MRKILSALLAVMMLVGVLAALPVFADEQAIEPVKTIDGTKETDFASANLVVTEVMTNSKSNQDKYNDIADTLSTSKTSSKDHFDYIEIYNRGDEAVNLYDYCLLRRNNTGIIHQYETEGMFDRQVYIAPGSIYQNAYGVNPSVKKTYSDVANPGENENYDPSKPASEQLHWLQPGQFAVIWFWNGDNDSASTDAKKSMAAPDTNNYSATQNGYYFPQFREHYNVSDDTIVLAVYGQNNATYAPKCFGLDNGSAYMYAIATNDFDIAEPAIEDVQGSNPELNSKIVSLFCWGLNTKAGIPTNDGTDHQATNYMPAIASPDLWNADEGAVNDKHNKDQYYDFVQTGHCLSYKEMAIFRYAEEPTVGSMPLYQWAYVDPEGLMEHWDELYFRAENEIEDVVYAKVKAIVEKAITDEVNADGGVPSSQKAGVIAEKIEEANAAGGRIDQEVAARLANDDQYDADLLEHYEDLLRSIICDYDEVMAYTVSETDTTPLLIDADGNLLTEVEGGDYIWAGRVKARFVELNKYVLVDVEKPSEELNDPTLVDREELEDKHNGENVSKLKNNGTKNIDGKVYTVYKQGSKEYYMGEDGKFYTLTVEVGEPVYETVKELSTVGLIIIIAAAVVVVAGIAVAVIMIAKKKNKPVAADDVASDNVQVIDESNNQQ